MKKSIERTCSRGHMFTGNEPCPSCWPGYRRYNIKAKVWLYPGESANWHFVTLPQKESDLIKKRFEGSTRGWGSLPVMVTVGSTSWKTSIFPDTKRGAYVLPLKAEVRKKERISKDDSISLTIEVQE